MIPLLKLFYIVRKVMASILFFSVFYVASIYDSKHRKLTKELPGKQITLLDIWRDLKNVKKNLTPKFSKYINTYSLEILSGYTQLFRSKMLFWSRMKFVPVVWIVKAEAVEELLSGTKNFEKSWFYYWLRPWINPELLTSHGQKWKSHRKLLKPFMHFDIWKDFLPTIHKKSQILVEILRKEIQKDWTDIGALISLCTLDVICETTLGVNFNTQENGKSAYAEAISRVSSVVMRRLSHPLYLFDYFFYKSPLGRQFKKDVKLIHKFTKSVLRHKKTKYKRRRSSTSGNSKALIDALLEYQLQYADLTEEDIREQVATFTFGGHGTTSVGIIWALYLIGLYQEVQDRIHEELNSIFGDDDERPVTSDDLRNMEYLDRVLKESQRLYPSVPMFSRRSDSGNVINGYNIPKGTAIAVLTYELHRDPEMFPNPEKFDPDRFLPKNSVNRHPYAYIPFSAGPRNCIGQRFAVIEEKVIIANILRNYSLESLEPRDKITPVAEMILRSAEPLKIRIQNL